MVKVLQNKVFLLMILISAVAQSMAAQESNRIFFIWPVRGRISSDYGYRISPITGRRMFHNGIDITAPRGTPVGAAMSGQVGYVGRDNTWGNYVVINHQLGYRTLYAHLHVVRVRVGETVTTGQRIGDVGSTGLSTGPHLHFAINQNDIIQNPISLMR